LSGYFESHAHYDDVAYDEDRHQLLSEILPEFGIEKIVNVGSSMKSSLISAQLATIYPNVYASVGVHPHEVSSLNEDDMKTLSDLTENKKVVAIGEIGLDYYRNNSSQEAQVYWFKKQLSVAAETNKPVIIHSRDAAQETFDILSDWSKTTSRKFKGVVHCFSSSWELAAEYVKLGFFIGIGGIVTYKNAKKMVEVVQKIPLEYILLETDCPYLSPEPKRGTRNDSRNLMFITKKLSEIVNKKPEQVISVTNSNSLYVFFS
jgi:TatD DNase family protein